MNEHGVAESRRGISGSSLTTGRVVLGLMIAVTSVFPLFFVEFSEQTTAIIIYKFLAKVGAFIGGMFLIWQFFLGFRGAVSSVFPDLTWVVNLHKKLGQYGTLVIPLHPVFIGLYYLSLYGENIYALDLAQEFSRWVLVGIILLGLIAFIVISSAFFRQKMGFYTWFYTHLSSYLVPPLLFAHSFALGPTVGGTPLRYFWWGLTGLMAILFVYRFAHKLGLFAKRYRTLRAEPTSKESTEILMEPSQRGLRPAPGQFVYLRETLSRNAHPYTVSAYDEESGLLGITAKKEGSQTARLQAAEEGDSFILDGPFGVFTRIALESSLPVVMIAGGIGITPFRRMWRVLERDRDREAWLFYGNEFSEDIVYRDEIDSLHHVRVVHVLNQEPDFPGEQGFITIEILRKYLPRDLGDYQFLLCGPPVMVLKLEEALAEAGIPDDRVRHELFAT